MLMQRKSHKTIEVKAFFAVTAEVKSLLRSCTGVVVLHHTQFTVLVIAALPTVSTPSNLSLYCCMLKYVHVLT